MQIDFKDVKDNGRIIDIRSSLDYEEYHVLDSINVPRIVFLSNPEKYISKNKKYYILCDKGKLSLSCSKILNALGYDCDSIKGGIEKIKKVRL